MGNYPEQDCKKLKQLERMTKVKSYLSLIKFSHTIFALPFALIGLVKWYELGALKYSERNWEKGMKFSRYTASMFRHVLKWMMGDESEDHLAAIMWNAAAIIHHQELGETQFDDMPHYLSKK